MADHRTIHSVSAHRALFTLVVSALCSAGSALVAQGTQSADAEITRLEHQWEDASRHNDTATFNRLMAPDYLSIRTDGVVGSREGRLRSFGSGAVRTAALELSEMRVRVDVNIAVVTGLATRRDTTDGRLRNFQYRYTRVWQREAGRWRVVLFQSTTVAPGNLGGLPTADSATSASGAPAPALAAATDVQAEVLAVDHRRQDALRRGDSDALAQILGDDFAEVGPNGSRTKSMNVDDQRSGRVRWDHLVVSDEAVTVFNPTTAALTGVLQGDGTASGAPFTRHTRYLRIYLKRNGQWQNVAAANTPIAP